MTDKRYVISIYPNGIDKGSSELVFRTQEEKSEYIQAEAVYCRHEHSHYLAELYSESERKKKKELFYKKRVEFAKKQGFSLTKKGVWEKTNKPKPKPTDPPPLGIA